MRLYQTWLHTIQDNVGFLIVLGLFLLWTIGVIIFTRLIVRKEMLQTEEERYPEKIKVILQDKDKQLRKMTAEINRLQERTEVLNVRIRSVKAWVAKIPEMLEGVK